MSSANNHLRFLLIVVAALVAGCGDREVAFEADGLPHKTSGLTVLQSASIEPVLTSWFGTPDDPKLPYTPRRLAELLDLEAFRQAAGPVISHEPGVTQGLYRRHCARCHGVTGDGRGPTARYQSPYPRDFRRGVFKWKSTYRSSPPTMADLDRVIEHGVPGTAMPSFALLSKEERDILRQYVVYLSIRGQAERALVDYVANELPPDSLLAFGEWVDKPSFNLTILLLGETIDEWADAEQMVVAVPERIDSVDDGQVARGRELYHSERAGCYKCHGPDGEGGVAAGADYELDHDIWNRDRLLARSAAADFARWDLPIRPSSPRRLVGATPHGGSSDADLFRRLHQGVDGTPMPAVGGAVPGAPGALSDDEIGALADYVATLLAPVRPGRTEVAAR